METGHPHHPGELAGRVSALVREAPQKT